MAVAGTAYETGAVTSGDGTVIGYRRWGRGPGVVLVHGSMMSAHNLMRLGTVLGREFTVHLPDRRGRGSSGPYGPGFTPRRAAEDVGALMESTGARNVFGLSAGAVPVLQWAAGGATGYRVALYEPPLAAGGPAPVAWLPRFEREMARGSRAAAMVTVARGTEDSRLVSAVPRALLVPLMGLALRAQARGTAEGEVPLLDLLPTMVDDARLVRDAAGLVGECGAVRSEVLLLGGSRSARYLGDALDALEGVLPRVRRVELRGVGHLAADNGGRPELVARALATFFRGGD
ncbi:alpha/beta hydrolase [Nocardiopsis sp. CT-R113]|uniref:Alpha/beta hydrolase n=1 Tax=Nocardiopsis codii TaxID=3065942 RepID=A0ABU7KCR5_9ACTN|nr:alpha/beta hydrolase [Nocardiopsis sp. CT-R113]MEE2040031.1 alpha/beta hydrolase [Nocardiopsis sp. CT-R113]